MRPLAGILLAMQVMLAGANPAAGQHGKEVIILFREDARPFSVYEAFDDTFSGYLRDLCVNAVTLAGYRIAQKIPINALQRQTLLKEGNPGNLGPGSPDGEFDLLCDPTTISLARMKQLEDAGGPDKFMFSPIVFLANGSYVVNSAVEESESPTGALPGRSCIGDGPPVWNAGTVVGTTAVEAIRRAIRDKVADFVLSSDEGSTGATPSSSPQICVFSFPDHTTLTTSFCRRELRFYVGDLDIIRANIQHYVDGYVGTREQACPLESGKKALSYEPYALIVSNRTEGFRPAFIRSLYKTFSSGTAQNNFAEHFLKDDPEQRVSTYLENLFRINQIPKGVPEGDPAP